MSQNSFNNQLLTSKDVCEILRISPRTLQTYRNNRMLAFMQIGRKIYYNVSEITEFLTAHHMKATNLKTSQLC